MVAFILTHSIVLRTYLSKLVTAKGAPLYPSSRCRILLHLRTSATFADDAHSRRAGAATVMPGNPAKPASPLRTVLALRAEVGADGLAFIMSRCAAAEHERRSWRGLAGARR